MHPRDEDDGLYYACTYQHRRWPRGRTRVRVPIARTTESMGKSVDDRSPRWDAQIHRGWLLLLVSQPMDAYLHLEISTPGNRSMPSIALPIGMIFFFCIPMLTPTVWSTLSRLKLSHGRNRFLQLCKWNKVNNNTHTHKHYTLAMMKVCFTNHLYHYKLIIWRSYQNDPCGWRVSISSSRWRV
jgi:hypothetical protein